MTCVCGHTIDQHVHYGPEPIPGWCKVCACEKYRGQSYTDDTTGVTILPPDAILPPSDISPPSDVTPSSDVTPPDFSGSGGGSSGDF